MTDRATTKLPAVLGGTRVAPRRMMLLGGGLAVVVTLLLASVWLHQPSYVPLYRGLDLAEAGRVSEQLTQRAIRYRLAGGGTVVEVPAADAARARVLLAQAGLPADGRPGLELFDKPVWGMTDFTQRVTYRRALEGELSRTIRRVRGVEDAQVHLALPESSPLRRLERPAQAAVVLTLRAGTSLAPETVRGIAHILSSSVEQLSVDHVAVLDDTGRLLSAPADQGSPLGLSSRQLELQRGVEQHLQAKVESLLLAAAGPGAARVEVAARLNFEQVDRTTESFDPDGQVLASEQRSDNEPGEFGIAQTVVHNSYQNSRRIEKIVGAVGTIERLSVAVLLDERAMATLDPGGTRRAGLEMTIRSAIGVDPARGDQLSLLTVPFGVTTGPETLADLPTEPAAPGLLELVERLARPMLSLLAILAAFLLGWRMLRPGVAARSVEPAGAPPAALAEPSGVVLAPTPDSVLLRNQLQKESAVAPETAVQVVRAWLAEA